MAQSIETKAAALQELEKALASKKASEAGYFYKLFRNQASLYRGVRG